MSASAIKSLSVVAAAAALLASCWTQPVAPVFGYETNDQDCRDGFDNDLDGLVDCDDPDCYVNATHCGQIIPNIPHIEPEDSPELCHDYIDNDDNGQYDCGDRKCQGRARAGPASSCPVGIKFGVWGQKILGPLAFAHP